MAITSMGYDGSVNETAWGKLFPYVGLSTFGVKGAGDLKVSAHPTMDKGLNIAAGSAWGYGVVDTLSSIETVSGAALASGTRYDLVVVSRNYAGAGGATTIKVKTGTSSRTLPAIVNTPGSLIEQPLALVRFQAGQNKPVEIIDLRIWAGSGGIEAADLMARDFMQTPGAELKIGSDIYRYSPDSNGFFSWGVVSGTETSTAGTVMRRDSLNRVSVGSLTLTSSMGTAAGSAARKDYVDQQVAKLATQSANGAMSAADKRKLDAAGSSSASNHIMMTDSGGFIAVRTPTQSYHPASKGYADGLGTASYTANTIMRRDGSGRVNVQTPSTTYHAANKWYVDQAESSANSYALSQANGAKSYAASITADHRPAASGQVFIGSMAAGASYPNQAVTFPAGRFTSAPNIVVVGSSSRHSIGIQSVTTSGAQFTVSNWTSASAPGGNAHWVAVQN